MFEDLPYCVAFENFGGNVGFYAEDDPHLDKYELDEKAVSFADVVNNWLWWGDGVARCFGEFEIFLKILVRFVDQYYRQGAGQVAVYNDGTGMKKYRMTSMFGDDPEARHGEVHAIFNRDNFQAAVFHNR